MKKNLCLSFSGGRTSAFMTQWCLKNLQEDYNMVVVFANTGQEHEKTLEFVDKCDKYFRFNAVWVEAIVNPEHGKGIRARIVDFKTASRIGEPFEAVISKYGIPNQAFPHCSRDLKLTPIQSYLKEQLGWTDYYTAIGIRADEHKRLNWEKAKENKLIYPLANMNRTTRYNINEFWSKMPFDLEIKSYQGNCTWCWKKSLRKLMTIALENPEAFNFPKQMEKKYGEFIPANKSRNQQNIKTPINFFRGNQSVEDLFEEAKFPFKKAIDESKDLNNQLEIWDDFLDANNGCVESCEVY